MITPNTLPDGVPKVPKVPKTLFWHFWHPVELSNSENLSSEEESASEVISASCGIYVWLGPCRTEDSGSTLLQEASSQADARSRLVRLPAWKKRGAPPAGTNTPSLLQIWSAVTSLLPHPIGSGRRILLTGVPRKVLYISPSSSMSTPGR